MKDLAVRIRAIGPLSVLLHLVVEPSFVNCYKLLFATILLWILSWLRSTSFISSPHHEPTHPDQLAEPLLLHKVFLRALRIGIGRCRSDNFKVSRARTSRRTLPLSTASGQAPGVRPEWDRPSGGPGSSPTDPVSVRISMRPRIRRLETVSAQRHGFHRARKPSRNLASRGTSNGH